MDIEQSRAALCQGDLVPQWLMLGGSRRRGIWGRNGETAWLARSRIPGEITAEDACWRVSQRLNLLARPNYPRC
jgi:hypothetical protein